MESQAQAAWLIAVLAGFLSFISPCVLPLIPGYLCMISGLSFDELQRRGSAHLLRILLSCLLFSIGFSVVFILVGFSAGAIGQWLRDRQTIINIVLGIAVIFFGLFLVGAVKLPFLYQDRRLRVGRRSLGIWGAPLLGFAFGFGWTPCIGPQLAMLIAIASKQPPAHAALLFAIFSATLSLCFIAAGILFASAIRAFSFLQRRARLIEIISGLLLILIGILLLTQQWDRAAASLMSATYALEQLTWRQGLVALSAIAFPVLWATLCARQAKRKARRLDLAIALGLVFWFVALIIYALLPYKTPPDSDPPLPADEPRHPPD